MTTSRAGARTFSAVSLASASARRRSPSAPPTVCPSRQRAAVAYKPVSSASSWLSARRRSSAHSSSRPARWAPPARISFASGVAGYLQRRRDQTVGAPIGAFGAVKHRLQRQAASHPAAFAEGESQTQTALLEPGADERVGD